MYIVAAARGAPTDLELTRPPQPNERRQPGSVNAPQHLDKTRFVVVHTFNLPSRQRNGRSNKCRRRLLFTSAIFILYLDFSQIYLQRVEGISNIRY